MVGVPLTFSHPSELEMKTKAVKKVINDAFIFLG